MSSGLRELRVWQESVALAGDVIRAVRPGIRRETKVLSDSIMLTAFAVGSFIADGFARPTATEQRESYIDAKRALLRLETELAIARQAELVPAGVFTELCARTSQVTRLLTGYLVYLDRQIAEREAVPVHAATVAGTPLPTLGSARAHG
ncbi:MAG: four helix bundle protein [bacterium]